MTESIDGMKDSIEDNINNGFDVFEGTKSTDGFEARISEDNNAVIDDGWDFFFGVYFSALAVRIAGESKEFFG